MNYLKGGYLKRGFQDTIISIKRHKLLFAMLLILQTVLVISSLALGSSYLLKILENAQGIIGPLENANYDSQQIEQGEPFVPDYAVIYNSYRSMLKNVFSFSLWMSALFLLLNGTIWFLSHEVLREQKSGKAQIKAQIGEGLRYLLKYGVSAAVLLFPFDLISYYLLIYFVRSSQSFNEIALVLKAVVAASFIVYYFFLVAAAAAPGNSWKSFARKWIDISLKKISRTGVVFLSVMFTLFICFGAWYGSIEYGKSTFLLLIVGGGSLIIISITRIFWIAVLQEIEHETSHH